MSEYETPDLDEEDEEETEGWLEHWFAVGGVSQKAQQAIESVDGKVLRMTASTRGYTRQLQETRINTYYPGVPPLYAVFLLHHPDDDDQGFSYFTDDGEKARKLFIRSADEGHDLYIYCEDGSTPRFESDTTQLRIVTDAEWFEIADEREGSKS